MAEAIRSSWWTPVGVWAEMVKLSHSVFALPFALMATFLAGRNLPARGVPAWGQMGLIVLCMVGARSAAMTFNRIVDAGIDAQNPRTQGRALPTGRLSKGAAWLMFVLSAALFVAACAMFDLAYANPWPARLALPVLLALCGYSFAKRITRWSHVWLGAGIGLAPAAAWLAIHPASLGWEALLLALTVTCWIGGFDIIYACQDIEVDRRDGLHSLPARLGAAKALALTKAMHAAALAALIALGFVGKLGLLYYAGVAAAAVLLVVENALVRPGDYARVNMAFFTINGVVSCVLAAATIGDVLLARPAG
ncbi:MAG: UbiA family prenyltransferase [Phycisphaerales bacterium]|nr:UbiA family prenyltransferase [Phycisphaerales bacterium]